MHCSCHLESLSETSVVYTALLYLFLAAGGKVSEERLQFLGARIKFPDLLHFLPLSTEKLRTERTQSCKKALKKLVMPLTAQGGDYVVNLHDNDNKDRFFFTVFVCYTKFEHTYVQATATHCRHL